MGFFNNVLPLSFQLDKSLRFGEFMRYVKHELVSVMSHQQVPFERLLDHAARRYRSSVSFKPIVFGRPPPLGLRHQTPAQSNS